MWESRFSIGIASSRSRPFPWGTPSTMSIRTTSASSFEAIQWAAVAPTFPEPTIVTFLRMSSFLLRTIFNHRGHRVSDHQLLIYVLVELSVGCAPVCRGVHILDNAVGELAGLDLGRIFHEPFEVVGDFLLLDRAFHAVLDQV